MLSDQDRISPYNIKQTSDEKEKYQLPYLPADRPHFFPEIGVAAYTRYKRFDTSLMCTRTHGRTVNWHFNVRFKCFLTYNTYNYPVLDLNIFFFPMKTIESLGCGQYAGPAYLRVNTVGDYQLT